MTNPEESWLFDNQFFSEKPGDNIDLKGNIWTHQKAILISRYLHSFLAVTRNGIYLDAFAGPQEVDHRDDSWAARKVLESDSIFLRRACLFERDATKIPLLEELRKKYCQGWGRSFLSRRQVVVEPGDCNHTLPEYLRTHPLKPKRAAFALLDQRTHECQWSLVRTLAAHKRAGNKVEIFYFLAQGWMDRSIKSAKTTEKLAEIEAWWGGSDWPQFLDRSSWERAGIMQKRFRDELGYQFTKAFPMKDKDGGKILFWLIHASDHPRANPLMATAYRSIYKNWSDERWEQTDLEPYLEMLQQRGGPGCIIPDNCSENISPELPDPIPPRA